MSKRIKTRYQNVHYIEALTNSKPDKIYYIRYRENGKSKEVKMECPQFCRQKPIQLTPLHF